VEVDPDEVVAWFELVQWHQGIWVPDIVAVLTEGPMRFKDLRRAINTNACHIDRWWFPRPSRLSSSQLSHTLAAMQRDELILRHEDRSRVPIAVSYELSPLMREFLARFTGPAMEWLQIHREPMDRVRQQRRHRRDGHPPPGQSSQPPPEHPPGHV
jgi:DNA-binding HxlR family transcriptional regulator